MHQLARGTIFSVTLAIMALGTQGVGLHGAIDPPQWAMIQTL